MEQFTDNNFMDVQRINFWQSDFNDTNPVDVPLITGEFYEQYFDDDMDLTSLFQWIILKLHKKNLEADRFRNFARLIIPGDRERITKNHIKNNISNIADTIFIELCTERRKFIIDFLSKSYLNMKNIINLSYNNNKHQYVYEIKFYRNICYTRVPVVTEDKEIRFADDDNYLYYETKTINCLSIIKINQSIELNDTIIEDTTPNTINEDKNNVYRMGISMIYQFSE
uniref:DUF2313 domain-containing protein n=1 Tax=Strongyloides venezuelensis TaxID=75913 RepID=A0A0K0FS06_STRVS